MKVGFMRNSIVLLFILLLSMPSGISQQAAEKLEVMTTLFPFYDFVRQIGKEKVTVRLLVPPGVEPHAFELKPRDIIQINKSDIFIYTGKYMEPWVQDMLAGIRHTNLLVIDASQGIELLSGEHSHSELHHSQKEDASLEKDPHIWLDLGHDQSIVDAITQALIERDPANKEFYLQNAKAYKLKLADLDSRFKKSFAGVQQRTILHAGHFAFGYFAKRYGLEYVSPYAGFSPNAEPSPKAIAELIQKSKQLKAQRIYYEELLDPKVARTIARETGVKLELLHGAHNVSKNELARGITFLEIMEDNLKKLQKGFGSHEHH